MLELIVRDLVAKGLTRQNEVAPEKPCIKATKLALLFDQHRSGGVNQRQDVLNEPLQRKRDECRKIGPNAVVPDVKPVRDGGNPYLLGQPTF